MPTLCSVHGEGAGNYQGVGEEAWPCLPRSDPGQQCPGRAGAGQECAASSSTEHSRHTSACSSPGVRNRRRKGFCIHFSFLWSIWEHGLQEISKRLPGQQLRHRCLRLESLFMCKKFQEPQTTISSRLCLGRDCEQRESAVLTQNLSLWSTKPSTFVCFPQQQRTITKGFINV